MTAFERHPAHAIADAYNEELDRCSDALAEERDRKWEEERARAKKPPAIMHVEVRRDRRRGEYRAWMICGGRELALGSPHAAFESVMSTAVFAAEMLGEAGIRVDPNIKVPSDLEPRSR